MKEKHEGTSDRQGINRRLVGNSNLNIMCMWINRRHKMLCSVVSLNCTSPRKSDRRCSACFAQKKKKKKKQKRKTKKKNTTLKQKNTKMLCMYSDHSCALVNQRHEKKAFEVYFLYKCFDICATQYKISRFDSQLCNAQTKFSLCLSFSFV